MPSADDSVRALLPLQPLYTPPNSTLRAAAAALRDRDVGALLVADETGFGIVSERDVVNALANGADPDEVWVADVMSQDVVVVSPSKRIVDAGLEMIELNIRHLVLTEGDEVIGVVSLRDVANALLWEAYRDSPLRAAASSADDRGR